MNLYDRLKLIIGEENLNKIKNTKIAIIGLGGVGGSAFETLVRNSAEQIFVYDFDLFEESNLNRQTLSNLNNIGNLKVREAEKFVKQINPNCTVVAHSDKLTKENLYELIPTNINYIIDACDDVTVKIELVKFAIKNNIKIISSMGTGNKLKPELLEITNIWKTENDPLAKKIRSILRKEKINYKLPVISSKENNNIKTGNIVGSFSSVPNTAGILLASYVLNDIIDKN